jgi:putative ABC transport system permease protein
MWTSALLRIVFSALTREKLRNTLCVLSLVIGVAAVITIVALGRGARTSVEQQIAANGTNLIVVSAGNRTAGGVRLGMGSSSRLTADDALAIRQEIRGVAFVSSGVRTRQQLINGGSNWSANVEGVGAELPRIRSWPLRAGRFFTQAEVDNAEKVAVIGVSVRDTLFAPEAIAVGQVVRIGLQLFEVVGVLSEKGQSSGGQDQDDAVFVPYTTAQKRLMGVTYLRNILVSAQSPMLTARVSEDIRTLLRRRHSIVPGNPDDFRVRSLDEIVALRTRMIRTMTALLSGIAAISLVVGGIGVMNIMLVSVTERTREIGIRLAIGARPRDVLLQFLSEAVVLSIAGGALGVVAGVAVANGITAWFGWPTELAAGASIGAFAFAALVGVFFGWYPAWRASAVDPIDALRFE